MATNRIINFVGGNTGEWSVTSIVSITGATVAEVACLTVSERRTTDEHIWTLAGAISNLRYTSASERADLLAKQAALGRATARRAALIPISKSAAWWAMAQDERLAVYARSQHTAIGMSYLPAVARRLHHGRDLGEPFDFLTWFEFAPEDEAAFDDMLARLRASEEWTFVCRKVDIRLRRAA